jgi:hypothetical protein
MTRSVVKPQPHASHDHSDRTDHSSTNADAVAANISSPQSGQLGRTLMRVACVLSVSERTAWIGM